MSFIDSRRRSRGGLVGLAAALIVSLSLSVGAAAAPQAQQPQHLRTEPLSIVTSKGVAHFQVQIADTDLTREKGLMFVKALPADAGMLFDFKTPQQVSFWMHNTLIPLDMIFIAGDGHVVSIASNAVPMDDTAIPSGGPVVGVLEIRGGRASQIGVQPGDLVKARMFAR